MATSAFGKAFRAARDSGDKEFEFEGKKYNTKYKEEASAPAKKAEPEKKAAPTKDTSNYSNEGRSTSAPAAKPDVTKMSANERTKQSIESNLSSARAGSGPTDTRSVGQRLRAAFGMKSGGSASSRADGIATKGKTRGKMC
jgi:hypothetical protein